MTFQEKFDELKAKYGKIDESKLSESFAVQIEMTDSDCGGIFYVAYIGGNFSVEPYDYHDNTAAVKVSSTVLEKLLSDKADAVKEFLKGNIKVDGKTDHALMVIDLMKKPEPKKAAAKKSGAKKTVKAEDPKAEVKAEVKSEEKKPAAKKATAKKPATKAKK